MALTATAPPDTLAALQSLLKDPVCTIASVNKPNICYSVHQIQSTGKSEYAYLTAFQSDKYEVVIFGISVLNAYPYRWYQQVHKSSIPTSSYGEGMQSDHLR